MEISLGAREVLKWQANEYASQAAASRAFSVVRRKWRGDLRRAANEEQTQLPLAVKKLQRGFCAVRQTKDKEIKTGRELKRDEPRSAGKEIN